MPSPGLWMVLAGLAAAGAPVQPLPLEVDAYGRASVEVTLDGGGPYRFLVDTGASLSSIAPRVSTRLRLPEAGQVRATSLGREGALALVRAPAIRVGPRHVTVPWMVLLPASPSHPLSRYDGILGQDVLRRFNFLIDTTSHAMWIDPPARVLAQLGLRPLDQASRSGPLSVADATGARWAIDTGASHVVLFTDMDTRRGGFVRLDSTLGPHPGAWAGASSVRLAGTDVSWVRAAATDVRGRAERGLLPLALFDALYVDNRRGAAHIVVRRPGKGGDPDVAADGGAFEGDGRVVRRPRGVADVAVR